MTLSCELPSEKDITQEIEFVVSKNCTIITRVKFQIEDVISLLMNKIEKLSVEIERLKANQISMIQDSLTELWDNKYDECWNEY